MQHQDYTLFFVWIVTVSVVYRKSELVIMPKLVLTEEHCGTPKTNELMNSHMPRGVAATCPVAINGEMISFWFTR